MALAGCVSQPSGNATGAPAANSVANMITIGTTDKVTTIDPAGSYDNGSYTVELQVYQFVMGFTPGNPKPQPDAAQSCSFTQPTVYECKLKPGLKFANGDPLDSAAVKFSFDRQLSINDPNGPASLLANLASVSTPDATTVDFHLKQGNDQTFQYVLATPAGPIVDPKVMSATALTPDADIVKANGFSGPFTITNYQMNQQITFAPYADYNGAQGKVANSGVILKTYTDANNLKLDIQSNQIDVASHTLSPTDIDSLKSNSKVTVHTGPGGQIDYIVFNFKTMPGSTDAQKLAIRQAAATLVDRTALATQVYKGTYTPLCSFIPTGVEGANSAVCDMYGSTPDVAKAKQILQAAGVATPVKLDMQFNPDHYGSSSQQEYAQVQNQLQNGGLFTVNLQSTEWVTYSKNRTQDLYPLYQLGWFPDFPDPDNYLTPFYMPDNFIVNHYSDPAVINLINEQRVATDPSKRDSLLSQVQTALAKDLPILPLLQADQVVVSGTNIGGITLDSSFQFRFAPLTKS